MEEVIQTFLTNSKIPSLNKEDMNSLDDPITMAELQATIKSLKAGKSPGPNEFTSQYYKTYTQLLYKPILGAFNNLAKNYDSNTLLMAHIAVIPKPEKDHTDCANFRPTSLLNVDI